jgi:hypothetical protein
MSSVLGTEGEFYVHQLTECGLSNLNEPNKNKLAQITLCSRHDAHGKLISLQKLISALEQHGKYCRKTFDNSTFIYSTNMVVAWRQRHRA